MPSPEELQLDVQSEEAGAYARALHRIVRSVHDGHCPKCGHLGSSGSFAKVTVVATPETPEEIDHQCPECHFTVTAEEAAAALQMFQPFLQRSVALFESWREQRT